MHSFTEWSNGDLAIRFVADRGYERIDIECTDAAGRNSWVPFEIVGLAAGLWNAETYARAVHEWYTQLDVEDSNTIHISLFSDPLGDIFRNMAQIKVATENSQQISKAEEMLSSVTAKSLEKLKGKFQNET